MFETFNIQDSVAISILYYTTNFLMSKGKSRSANTGKSIFMDYCWVIEYLEN